VNYYEMLTDAKAIDDHRVFVTFEGGQTGLFDCSGYFGKPYWRKLSDPAFFKCAHVSYGTLTWPEDIDIEPEEVWEDAVRTDSPSRVNPKSRPQPAATTAKETLAAH